MADSSLLPFPKMNMASWERDAAAASAGIGSTVDDEEDDNEDYEKSPQRRSFAQYANEAASRPYAHMPPYSAPPHLGDGYNQFYSLYAPDEQVQRITSQAATYQSTASFAAHPGQQESFSPDENRKPAARPQPEKEKKHVKRHSISSDPYYEQGHAKQVSGFASPPTIQEGTKYSVEFGRSIPRIRSPHDQFINPTMSFGDDDDLREWPDAHIFALQAPEQYVASPPPVASYPPPPPISFSFRDTRVQQSPPLLPPPTLSEAMAPPVPPIRPSRKSRMANRQHIAERLPPIEKIGSHLAFKDLRPSAEEMSAATTPRAQAALEVWYSRLSQLYQYKLEHNGDTNVPQKYKPNPSLGIVEYYDCQPVKFFFASHHIARILTTLYFSSFTIF
jgi:hypothetical protein